MMPTSNEFSETEAKGGHDLLLMIGRIMTGSQGVEYAICEVFLAFFPPNLRDVPSVAYHSIRTFDARRRVVHALVKRYCNSEQCECWRLMEGKVDKRFKVRSAVAHGMATVFGKAPNRKWGISPSPYDIADFEASTTSNSYYTAKELGEARQGIIHLTLEIDAFRASIESDVALQSRLLLQQTAAQENTRVARVVARTHRKLSP